MPKDLFERFHVEVVAAQESDGQYTDIDRHRAARELLQAMSEMKYSPTKDPALKRFEDRLRGVTK